MHADEYTPLRDFASQFLIEWRAFRESLTRRFLKKGEYLTKGGEVCEYVSFINCGSLRVFMEVREQEISKHFFFEREYASDYASFLTRSPGKLNIKALEDTELMQLSYEKVQRLYEGFPVWQKFGRLIAEDFTLQWRSALRNYCCEPLRKCILNCWSKNRISLREYRSNTSLLIWEFNLNP